MSDASTLNKILLIGVEESIFSSITELNSEFEIVKFNEEFFYKNFEDLSDGQYLLIIAGSEHGKNFLNEVGQILSSQCSQTPTIAISLSKENFDFTNLIKNGFKNAFLWSLDQDLIRKAIEENIAKSQNQKIFKRVSVFDITAETVLDFDTYVFLPLNNKFIRYTAKNTKFSETKKKKMIDKEIRNLHVDLKDIDRFYEYSAVQLSELSDEANPMSETEKEEKLHSAIRDLFYQVLDENATPDFSAGKAMIGTCQKIISNFITKGETSNWYAQLIRTMSGQTGDYSHSSEVSTYASLFGIGLGYKNVEDLAIAGMLHDVGLVTLPQELVDKAEDDEDSLTDEEKDKYYTHIVKGLDIIKRNRMVLPDNVVKAIEQHHEKWNGKGYPKGKSGNSLTVESQILILADRFQKLVAEREGKKRLSPIEALEKIKESGAISAELYSRVSKLFKKEKEESL